MLVNWLNEILYLQETQREIYQEFKIASLTDTELEATLQGAPSAPTIKFIKAVTFHDLQVRQTEAGWEATIVVDV